MSKDQSSDRSQSTPHGARDADSNTEVQIQAKSTPWNQVVHSKWLILGMLFGVTGFLGLPVLWISPAFSTTEKWIWSIINTLYTSALIAICFLVCWWAYRQIYTI